MNHSNDSARESSSEHATRHDAEGCAGSRLWMGCCGGCAGLFLMAVVGIGAGFYLLLRPRPVAPPEAFLLPDAQGFAVLQLRDDDDGLVAFLKHLAEAPPPGIGLSEEERRALHRGSEQIRPQLKRITPFHLVAALYRLDEPQTIEEYQPTFEDVGMDLLPALERWMMPGGSKRRFDKGIAVSLRPAGGLMQLFVRTLIATSVQQGGEMTMYRGVRTGSTPKGLVMSAVDGTVMVADRGRIVYDWIDRLKDDDERTEPGYNGPPHLEDTFRRLDRSAPVYGGLSNRNGELLSLLQSLMDIYERDEGRRIDIGKHIALPPFIAGNLDAGEWIRSLDPALSPLLSGIRAVGASLHLVGPDTARLVVHAECIDADYARAVGDALTINLNALTGDNVTVEGGVEHDVAHWHITHHAVRNLLQPPPPSGMSSVNPLPAAGRPSDVAMMPSCRTSPPGSLSGSQQGTQYPMIREKKNIQYPTPTISNDEGTTF